MRTFTVLLVFGLVAASHQQDAAQKEEFHAWRDECLQTTGTSKDVVKNGFRDNVFADDVRLKCYFKCMLLKNGVMNDAGVINTDAFKGQIPSFMDRAKAEAAVEKCKSVKEATPCEIAFEFEKCMHTELGPPPQHGPPPTSKK